MLTDMATDYLTCGQCLREFPLQCITLFIQHKKLDCDDETDLQNENPELKCNYCPQGFMTAWALLVHAQLTHNLKIFLEKASKSLLNQVKLSPVSQGDNSKNSGNIKICLPISGEKFDGTKNTQQRLVENSETSLPQERDKTDHLFPVLNDTQPSTGISPQPNKMGSNFIVTRNTSTGTKKVGEKMEPALSNMNLEKSVTRNTVVNVSSTPQINTSQKLSLLPVNQVSASFLPKLSVLPLTVSSGQVKTSSIKVLPTMLTRTVSQPLPESTVNSVLKVLKKEVAGTSVVQNDTPSLNNQMLTQETSAVLHPSTATVLSPSTSKLTSQATKSTENLTVNDTRMSTQLVTSVASKSIDSSCTIAETTVSLSQSSDSAPLPTDGDNQRNNGVDEELDNQGPECCNRQGCGVTVIPGSHEDLQECCNAVLPKKRKRHMELKHMPFSWSSSRYARRKRSSQLMSKPSTGTIYIDLEPDSSNSNERPADEISGTAFKVTQSASQGVKILGTSNSSVVSSGDSVSQSKAHSLILKPGAVFSIPFTYTIPTSKSLQNTIGLPVARETFSLAETGQQTGSSSSSACVMVDLPKLTNEGNQSLTGAQCMLPNLDTVAEGQILQLEKGKKYGGMATKPFQCDKCTMAFNQRIHLKKHMSKHTGIKPYKCGECNYSTVERSHLKVHIRIHTGEKPFKCTYCEYATAQNSTLKIHLKRHHGGRMFQCQTCEKQFTQEQQLKGHVLEHGSPPSLPPDQKAPNNGKAVAQQSYSALQLPPANTQTSNTTHNAPQASSADRYSSQEEVLASLSTNQQQEPVHVDTKNNISQSG